MLLLPIIGFSQVSFQSSNYQACADKASIDGQPFMVYVYAEWCLPCQLMDTGTFQDENLSTSIVGKVNPYKIDFDSDLGRLWKRDFDIACLPTTLLFDSEGVLLDRIESSFTSEECIGFLAEYNLIDKVNVQELSQVQEASQQDQILVSLPKAVKLPISKEEQISNSISVIEELINSGSLSEAANSELEKSIALLKVEISDEVVRPVVVNENPTNQPIARTVSYITPEPEIKVVPEALYEVQLGFFKNESNAVKLSADINSNTAQRAYILQEYRNGVEMYRVLLGSYADKNSATIAYEEVKSAGYKAFLKKR